MAENKTRQTKASVKDFLDAIPDEQQRRDAKALDRMMREVSGEKPALWGPSIVGYGFHHYEYASGHGGDCAMIGFSPRKAALTLYVMGGFPRYDALMQKLGKFKTGKSCLYIKKLADVDPSVLRELLVETMAYMRNHPAAGC